jgi:RNA-directed DNA polymerase
LPQGAPTSPTLTNVVCQKLDIRLTGVAKRFGLRYSRYADDITFSSMHDVYKKDGEFINEIERIIKDQGFEIKESKTRLQKAGFRQEVTGLVVNEKANVQQRYIKQLRMWLYYWERYGYDKAYYYFFQQYMTEKGNIVKGKPNMEMVICGKLNFLKMVKGLDNEIYSKLKNRFDILVNKPENTKIKQNHLENVLELLFNKGLNDAMNFYKH